MTSRLGNVTIWVLLTFFILLACTSGTVAAGDHPDHVHPDEADETGDQLELAEWLSDEMAETHVDCSEGLVVGEFDACDDLDSEYESLFERFVTVEDETSDEESNQTSADFEEAREKQAELAELLQEFNQTRTVYQKARANGNQAEAREAARELQRLADRIDALGGDLNVVFIQLDRNTNVDLQPAIQSTNRILNDTIAIALEAEQETFVETNLTASSDSLATFSNPAIVSGVLQTADGKGITGRNITIADDAGFSKRATTGANGSFRVTYRPIRTATGSTELNITFSPTGRDQYLSAATVTSTTVESTPLSLQLNTATLRTAFGDAVGVEANVTAGEAVPEGLPVTLRIENTTLGTGTVDESGAIEIERRLPAGIVDGLRELEIQAAEAGMALSPATATRPIVVDSTATNLSAGVNEQSDQRAYITGTLTTTNGTAVSGQPITVATADTTATSRTSSSGKFELTVDRPEVERSITVSFEANGTNLEGTATEVRIDPAVGGEAAERTFLERLEGTATEVRIDPAVGGEAAERTLLERLLSEQLFVTVLIGVLAVLAVSLWSVALWLRFSEKLRQLIPMTNPLSDSSPDDIHSSNPAILDELANLEPAITRVSDDSDNGVSTEQNQYVRPLEAARSVVAQEPNRAVQIAYGELREAYDVADHLTHRAIYTTAKSTLNNDDQEALQDVLQAFERATFTAEGVDEQTARTALDKAEWCLLASGDAPEQS